MKKILGAILVIALLVAGYKLLSRDTFKPNNTTNPDMVLFWGNGCPHCEKVKDYIKNNKVDTKLKIDQKEVYYDKANQALMAETAQKCQLDTSKGLGVPFAYMDSQCYVGDQPIIDAINQKIGSK